MARGFKAVSVIAAGIIAVGLSAGSAHAVFINGSVGLGDAGITLSNLPGSMVSALTSMTLGSTAVPGPCMINFVGCNANSPGDDFDASTCFRCHDRTFLDPGRRHAFHVDVWHYRRVRHSDGTGKHWRQPDYRQHTIHRHRNGRRRPRWFRPHICHHQFQRKRQLCWHRHHLQCGYRHRHLAGDVECRGHPHPGSRTRYDCPSRFGLAGLGLSRRKKA